MAPSKQGSPADGKRRDADTVLPPAGRPEPEIRSNQCDRGGRVRSDAAGFIACSRISF